MKHMRRTGGSYVSGSNCGAGATGWDYCGGQVLNLTDFELHLGRKWDVILSQVGSSS